MRINLPTDLLRSFITIVETGSMVRASEHVFLTQSALSLQMKRLTEIVRQPIFRRQQGAMVLTGAGEQLLACAREMLAINDTFIVSVIGRLVGPVRIGMVQDFADVMLSNALKRFKKSHPDIRMEIRIGNSAELREQFAAGLLDISLCLGDVDEQSSVATSRMSWLGDPDLLLQPVLPLAIMTKPCLFREAAVAALEADDSPYEIALETPSISVLKAAVDSGLAVTCRTLALVGAKYPPLVITRSPLPEVAYCLSVQRGAHEIVAKLAEGIETEIKSL